MRPNNAVLGLNKKTKEQKILNEEIDKLQRKKDACRQMWT